jgi:hypothetical protein
MFSTGAWIDVLLVDRMTMVGDTTDGPAILTETN